MRLTRVLSPLIVLTALAFPATVVHAQRYWHDEQGRDAFRLDFAMPFLKGDGHKFFTGTFVPSLSLRAGEGFRVEADIPSRGREPMARRRSGSAIPTSDFGSVTMPSRFPESWGPDPCEQAAHHGDRRPGVFGRRWSRITTTSRPTTPIW